MAAEAGAEDADVDVVHGRELALAVGAGVGGGGGGGDDVAEAVDAGGRGEAAEQVRDGAGEEGVQGVGVGRVVDDEEEVELVAPEDSAGAGVGDGARVDAGVDHGGAVEGRAALQAPDREGEGAEGGQKRTRPRMGEGYVPARARLLR